ncbi:MAG: SDR family oxidoreductase [Nannocystaceae bacterium]
MSLVALLKPKGPSGFGYGSTAEDVTEGLDLSGKNILVTGVNSGLGAETLRVLALRGARVLGCARDETKASAACAPYGADATPFACDLGEPASIRACVDAVRADGAQLDAILCNAGIMALPKRELLFGVERQLFTNHIGHFMLVTGLLDQLRDDARVVMTSSGAHMAAPKGGINFDDLSFERKYSAWAAYGQSKFANLLFAKELARRFAGSSRTANAVHPGVIYTNLGRHMHPAANVFYALSKPLFLKSIPQGAATQCYVATHPQVADISGEYFADCNVAKPRRDASDPETARRLWEASEAIVAGLP